MKDYTQGALVFTKNVLEDLIHFEKDSETYKKTFDAAFYVNGNVRFHAIHSSFRNEEDLKKIFELVDYIVESNGKGSVGINVKYVLTFPSEITDGIKKNLEDEAYITRSLHTCVEHVSGKDLIAFKRPFNFPFESYSHHFEDVAGIIQNPFTVVLSGKLVFAFDDIRTIEEFKKSAFIGTFCMRYEDTGGYNNRKTNDMRFDSSSDSWTDGSAPIWGDFPYKRCAIGLYTHYKNPNVFALSINPEKASRGGFSLTYLPNTEMDIEGAIESATASLFKDKSNPSAKEIISVLCSVSQDKRLAQFIDLRYTEDEFIFNSDETSSWDSNIFFRLNGNWRSNDGAIHDVHNLLLGAKRAVRMFSGIEDLLKELKASNENIVEYTQKEFKNAIKAFPMKFTGEKFDMKSDYSRLALSGNPKIRDLAKMILSRLDSEFDDVEVEDDLFELDDADAMATEFLNSSATFNNAIFNPSAIVHMPTMGDSKVIRRKRNEASQEIDEVMANNRLALRNLRRDDDES